VDGVRLSPDIRGTFGKLVKKGLAVTRIAELFDTTRQTVHRWLKGKIADYRDWFNHSRFHRGVKAFPVALYECNVRNLT
jgi:DNA invertase Pin-like site-specific DNA recombinase